MISYIITLLVGFVAGALVFRNNAKKAEAAVEKADEIKLKGKYLLDVLKGRNK
jgi:F0F1-type ATP synthase assembly protein I